jgi:transcriptional regulator with GAF, ATPase, and Fis domain
MIEISEAINEIDISNMKAWEMVRTDPGKTLELAKHNLKRSEELEYLKGIAWSKGNIGAACSWLSEYEAAIENSYEAVELLHECEEYLQEVQLEYYLFIVFYFLADEEKQLEHVLKSLEKAEAIDDIPGQANALNGLGTVHYTFERFDEAVEVLEKGWILAKQIMDPSLLARISNGLGIAYLGLGKFNQALETMEEALKHAKKSGELQPISYVYDGIGEIYSKLGEYAKAIDSFQESYKVRDEMGFKIGMGTNKLHMAETNVLAGDNLSAVQSYKDALVIGKDLGSKDLIYKSHLGLSELYEDMGNLTLFVKHFKAYHEAQSEYNAAKQGKKIKAFELKGKLDQIQKEKEDLEKSNLELQSYFKDVQTLSSIGNEITSTLDLEAIFQIIYERINSLMDASGIFIGVTNYEQNLLQVKLAIDHGKRDAYFEYSLDDQKISNYTIKKGEAVHISEYGKEIYDYFPKGELLQHSAPESVVVIPLIVKENIIGVLYAQSEKVAAFSKHHFNILQSFANYLSIAIDNATLYEQMDSKVNERTEELAVTYKNSELLNKIGQELISTLDFEDVFEKLYHNVNKLMDATIFGVRLYDKENSKIRYLFEYERGLRLRPMEASTDDKNNYSVWCIDNKKAIHINDNKKEYKKYVEKIVVIDGEMPNSIIFYPLISNDEVIGVISVQSFEINAYSSYHMTIVRSLAQYTVLALQNARRYEVMEEKVEERTSEISRSYENTQLLSEIGKNITSQLSVENIIRTVYDSINKLMDAEGFGIGIANLANKSLAFPGYIESGKKLDDRNAYDLKDNNRLACVCFNKEKDIVINDFENEYSEHIDIYVEPKVGKSVTSLIYLPIRSKKEIIGVITVQSFGKDSYQDYHVSMLRSIGVYVGIAIDNATLYENMEEMVKERTSEVVEQKEKIEQSFQNIKLISQINKDISESLSIGAIIDRVYENVNTLMDATGFGIGVYNEETGIILMTGYIENGKKLADFEYVIDDDRLATWCFKNKKEIFIKDYAKEYKKYIKGIQTPVSGEDSASVIYIPLFSKEKIVGLITVQSFEADAYTEYHMDVLKGLAASIGSAVENAILYSSLEDKVKVRTEEVVKQKEQIEKASENTKLISKIGKEIASELSSVGIISKVYEGINDMMEASIFGIAVYKEDTESLYFSGAMEQGNLLDDFEYGLKDEKIATICFLKNEEIIINDWEKEFKNYVAVDYSAAEGEMPESMIYLPIVSKENKIGVLTVQSFNKNVYDEYHLNILRTLSLYIASALENASLYKDMEDRVKERTAEIEKAYEDTKLLSKISRAIVESLELETIIAGVYENINTLLDATCFGIGVYNSETNTIKMPGFIEDGKPLDNVEFDADDMNRLASACYKNEKEIFISDFLNEYKDHVTDVIAPVQGEGTNSIVYIPLRTQEKVVGVLTVQSYQTKAYTQYHMSLLRSLAITVATAIDNAMLYENMEEKVEERTLELSEQKEIIEEKNKHITDSIRYAKRIQDATLPSIGLVRSLLPDSFVLFKPKDIVSGDFYWIEQVGDNILFAVVDCTGHGVPGAFLSLIGHNSLNQIIHELGVHKPSEILFELDKIVYSTLQNNLEQTNIKDGMDMAICSLNLKTKSLEFAGAYNPLYLVRDKELSEIKGDKLAIGAGKEENLYNNTEMQLEKGDRIYLFSDGYADQFGGPKGKKFKYSQFKELLLNIHLKPMDEQQKLLNHFIEAWQGELEQLDDVCVIGVSV